MAELFRYIQHAFVVPSARLPIDVGRQSDLQGSLRDAISRNLPPDQVRGIADTFIARHFSSPRDDPFQMRSQLLSFGKLLAPTAYGSDTVEQLIASTFDSDAPTLAASDAFQKDKALLDDILVAVKITTAFDRVNPHELVAMRQTIAFIEDFAARTVSDEPAEEDRAILRRPIRIPSEFVKPLSAVGEGTTQPPPPDPASEAAARQRSALVAEQEHLKRAYEAIMNVPPDQFELKPVSIKAERAPTHIATERSFWKEEKGSSEGDAVSPAPSFLAVPAAAVEHLGSDVRQTLEKAHIDIAGAPVAHVIAAIKRQWEDVSQQLAPYQAPAPAKVFRLGAHLFAIQDSPATTGPATGETR